MKTRQSLVSNSSSTSFLVLRKRIDLDESKLLELNTEKWIEMHGDVYEDHKPRLKGLCALHQQILVAGSIEYGEDTEQQIEALVKELSKALGADNVTIEWEG